MGICMGCSHAQQPMRFYSCPHLLPRAFSIFDASQTPFVGQRHANLWLLRDNSIWAITISGSHRPIRTGPGLQNSEGYLPRGFRIFWRSIYLEESKMFVIDRSKNLISRLPVPTFSALGIKERSDFQEWLANTPDALGEELLIIQKEFAGFEGTNERFDLLALDKEGSLVIIENKLDDSGSGVVWQVLKYVAYCSSLKKSQIVDIFQDYLKQQHREGSASNIICKFLEADALEEVILNSGSGQRLILVAANFRKEVTSAILWLISNGIRAQCMKVTPYALNGIHLLDIKQIIPPPEARGLYDRNVIESQRGERNEDSCSQAPATQTGNSGRKRLLTSKHMSWNFIAM